MEAARGSRRHALYRRDLFMPVTQNPTDQHWLAVSGNHQAESSGSPWPENREKAHQTEVSYNGMKSQHCCLFFNTHNAQVNVSPWHPYTTLWIQSTCTRVYIKVCAFTQAYLRFWSICMMCCLIMGSTIFPPRPQAILSSALSPATALLRAKKIFTPGLESLAGTVEPLPITAILPALSKGQTHHVSGQYNQNNN